MSYRVNVDRDGVMKLMNHPGLVMVHRYFDRVPLLNELGSMGLLHFFVSTDTTIEFVTTDEFVALSGYGLLTKESSMRGHIFNTTFITLVPEGV